MLCRRLGCAAPLHLCAFAFDSLTSGCCTIKLIRAESNARAGWRWVAILLKGQRPGTRTRSISRAPTPPTPLRHRKLPHDPMPVVHRPVTTTDEFDLRFCLILIVVVVAVAILARRPPLNGQVVSDIETEGVG